jgi:drug/metabolite transporter (DMT)-like permease
MFGLSPHVHAMATFFLFALMNSCIKALGPDFPVSLEMVFRFWIGIVAFYPMIRRAGGYRNVLRTHDIKGHVMRAAAGLIAVSGSFYTLHLLPMSDVNALGQTYPFFLLLLSIPILKERVTIQQGIACVFGFLGVVVIMQPHGGSILFPMLIILGVALAAAASDLVVRRLSRQDSNLTIVLWFFVLSGAASLFAWLFFGARAEIGLRELALLVAAGVFGSLAQMAMTEAFRYLGAGTMGPYSFMGFFWSTVCGWALFAEAPNVMVLLGALLIIGGAQITYFFSRSHSIPREATPISSTVRADTSPKRSE